MAKGFYKIEGLEELNDALSELSKATARNVVTRVLTEAAQPVQATAQALAPKLTGKLSLSISIGRRLSRRQRRGYRKESDVEVFMGAFALPHAHLQEFGTVFHAPHPFLRPAWDQHKTTMLVGIKDKLAEEIEKTRARVARKAERLAAKMT